MGSPTQQQENIRAYVRVRPVPGESSVWEIVGDDAIRQLGAEKHAAYTVDRVFDPTQSNEALYKETTQGLVRQVVEEGLNATVFAYGQTSSGKTHTMRGSAEDPGVIPRAVVDLIRSVRGADGGASETGASVSVTVSYMEIYNEEIRDLLAEAQNPLSISSRSDGGVVVQGLSELVVESVEEVMDLLDKGDAQRRVGETKMNAKSSRSHAIFKLVLGRREGRRSELTLVDLAGSERLGKTRAEGQRQKEGAAINKSLLVLGTVISKLSRAALGEGKEVHVPYRDSKLTRVLQPALGGNAKTAIICAITPAAAQTDESHNSLMFACRAKTVLNDVQVGGSHGPALTGGDGEGGRVADAEAVKRVVKRKVERATSYMLFENTKISAGPGNARRQSWSGERVELDRGVQDSFHRDGKRSRRVTFSVTEEHREGLEWGAVPRAEKFGTTGGDAPRDTVSVVERYKRDLEAVKGELKRVKQAKGDALPALKEAQWKNRQLEKDVQTYKAELERYMKMGVSGEMEPNASGDARSETFGEDVVEEDNRELINRYEAQIVELQACADAASAHVRYLEDKADQESRDREVTIAEMESSHTEKVQALERTLRDLEDAQERSKLEIHALQSESKALKEENDGLLKRIGMASGTLNALDELRDLKKKHREEIGKLNGQIRNLTVGSKGNERVAERAAKDTNRLKNQIQDLEIKLKKAVAEKSALQSEKATIDREHRVAKASLEKLNKNADRAAAAEERRRQPIIRELEETKSKLTTFMEQAEQASSIMERERGRAEELQQDLDASRTEAAGLAAALEDERETTAALSAALDMERSRTKDLEVEVQERTDALNETSRSLQEANKNVAKLHESVKSLKGSVEQAAADRAQLESSIDALKQEKQLLEDSLEAAETKAEVLEGVQLDLDAERAQVAALQKNFEVMEKGLEDHKQEVKSLKKALVEKEEHASSLEGSINELTSRAAELEAALDAAGTEIRKTKSLLSQAEHAIEDHEATITEIHRDKMEAEKALGELEREAEELRQGRAGLVEERARLDDLIQNLQAELQSAKKALKDEISGGNARLDDMLAAHEAAMQLKCQELEEARLAQERLELEAGALRAEITEHELSIQKLHSDKKAAAAAATERDEAAAGYAQELQYAFDRQLQEAREKLDAERAASKYAQEQLEDSKEAAKKAAADLVNARERLDATHGELQTAQGIVSELREQIQTLRASREMDGREKTALQGKLAALQGELEELRHSHELDLEAARAKASNVTPAPAEPMEQLKMEMQCVKERYMALERELRKSKRREEKLQALQYRLQMDVKESGGCLEALNNLRNVRELEFDLDRAQNQILRLRAQIDKAGKVDCTGRVPLEPTKSENIPQHM